MTQDDEEGEAGKHVRCHVIDYVGTIMEPSPTSLCTPVHPSGLSLASSC